jgi:hypothetical protein
VKQAILSNEQKLYIEGTEILGVQSVNGSYSISEKPINILGYGHVDYGFNYLNQESILDYSSVVQDLQTERKSHIDSESDVSLITDGGEIPFEDVGEDIDFRKNWPFEIRSEEGLIIPPYKSLAVLNAPLQGSFSINSLLIGKDFFFPYIGDNPFSGSIHHGDKFFGFNQGYISSHSVSCSVGSIPSRSTSIRVFGDIGGEPGEIGDGEGNTFDFIAENSQESDEELSAKGDGEFPKVQIIGYDTIELSIGGAEIDRVMSFEHSMSVTLDPIYAVGDYKPVQVDVVWPMTSRTTFTIEVDEYRYGRLRSYLHKPTLHDLAIRIKDCDGKKVQNYTVVQARLVEESISASVGGRLTVNLSYNSYYNKRRWQ